MKHIKRVKLFCQVLYLETETHGGGGGVEASNLINVPKCYKGPKCNKNLVLNVIKVLNVILTGS